MKRLWIVGKINSENHKEWEFVGVFDKKEKALKACKDDKYFVGPVMLNESCDNGTISWPEAYYPFRYYELANGLKVPISRG